MASNDQFSQTDTIALLNGADSAIVTFPVQFVTVPYSIQVSVLGDGSQNIFATVDNALTNTKTFTVTLSAPIPSNNFTLTYTAIALQTPPIQPGGDCGCGTNANVANACPVPQVAAYLFTGNQGVPGPLAFFRGPYNAGQTYFDNTFRVDVITYAGFYWRANNTANDNTASWGTPAINAGDWLLLGPISTGLPGGYNSAGVTNNIGGNSVITPSSANHTESVVMTGAAGAYILAIATAGRNPGDVCNLQITFPATAGLVINVRNNTVGGTQLLPTTSNYAANAYTTNGIILSATWSFTMNAAGTAWQFLRGNTPS